MGGSHGGEELGRTIRLARGPHGVAGRRPHAPLLIHAPHQGVLPGIEVEIADVGALAQKPGSWLVIQDLVSHSPVGGVQSHQFDQERHVVVVIDDGATGLIFVFEAGQAVAFPSDTHLVVSQISLGSRPSNGPREHLATDDHRSTLAKCSYGVVRCDRRSEW
jgi:hypothetical protein